MSEAKPLAKEAEALMAVAPKAAEESRLLLPVDSVVPYDNTRCSWLCFWEELK